MTPAFYFRVGNCLNKPRYDLQIFFKSPFNMSKALYLFMISIITRSINLCNGFCFKYWMELLIVWTETVIQTEKGNDNQTERPHN